jgi:multidrug efflux pump subunit AcrB
VGDQVNAYVAQAQARLPEGITLSALRDSTKTLRDRVELLSRGVMFATVISLVLVPTGYMIMEDLVARVRSRGAPQVAEAAPFME